MYDNKILRKFRGHTDVVNHISMNPADDTFLTSSRDRTVRCVYVCVSGCVCVDVAACMFCITYSCMPSSKARSQRFFPSIWIVCWNYRLWSLQQAGAIGILELPSQAQGDPHVAFDSTGLVFGITAAMTAGQGHVSLNRLYLLFWVVPCF